MALSDEQVADGVTTWAGRVAAGEARLLLYIGELDRREAWATAGMLSCAHWLAWRLGMGQRAAYERVRVARALRGLPATTAAFSAGLVSWSQVRAISRIACAADEQTYLELARHATGGQLERLARGVRRARRVNEDAADPELAAYRMRTRVSYDEEGTLVITTRLPAEQGAVVLAALEAARAEIDHERRPPVPADCSAEQSELKSDQPPRASVTDGLLRLSQDYLAGLRERRPDAARRARPQLIAQVDPLFGWSRLRDGEFLPASRLRDLGRTRREPDLGLRELLGTIDGERCRYPGCNRRRRLHAHHVVFWSAGGPTDLGNLVLLCPRHHTLVHALSIRLRLHHRRALEVRTADGRVVPHRFEFPWRSAAELDPDAQIGPATLPPTTHGDRLDLDYAVSVLLQQAA